MSLKVSSIREMGCGGHTYTALRKLRVSIGSVEYCRLIEQLCMRGGGGHANEEHEYLLYRYLMDKSNEEVSPPSITRSPFRQWPVICSVLYLATRQARLSQR